MASIPPFFMDVLLRYASSILLLLATTFVGVFLAASSSPVVYIRRWGGPLDLY
jgi:hypothetical protein